VTEAKLEALAEYVRYLRDCMLRDQRRPEALEDWIVRVYGCAWAELGSA